MRRAERKASKRIHRLCCSLLQQLWNPTLDTDGPPVFDVQLGGSVLIPYLYHQVRIAQKHVKNGVIPPDKIRVGGRMR